MSSELFSTDDEIQQRDVYKELEVYGRLIRNKIINETTKGKAYAELGLLCDYQFGYLEIAQFCYERACELLNRNDPLLPVVKTAKSAILGDRGKVSEAIEELKRAANLFQNSGQTDQANFAIDLISKIESGRYNSEDG